jgi:hypothetical protein
MAKTRIYEVERQGNSFVECEVRKLVLCEINIQLSV